MAKKSYRVVWTNRAQKQLNEIHNFITKDSPQSADKLLGDIFAMLDKVSDNPEIYSPDKYKLNNDNTYRAFEKHRYRISYRFKKNDILVLRIRHTSMKPLTH